ncbi:MAG TPA: NAD(P)H-dependent oxidoreductase [Polyangiales bacterium]|nr:NAD(P)H-dependent oxidoreductase [Polyangiales bacterium]
MKSLLVVYHTQSGNTERLARAVVRGAERNGEIEVRCSRALAATLEDLLGCDCVVFGTAEYNGYMSGALKDFFDRTFYPAQGLANNKPYAVVVSAGNDGTFAVQYIERIARGYPLKRVAEPIVVVGEVTSAAEARCEELGETLAAGLELGIF